MRGSTTLQIGRWFEQSASKNRCIREDNDPEYGKQGTSKFFVLMSTQFFRTFNGCVLSRMGSLPFLQDITNYQDQKHGPFAPFHLNRHLGVVE